MRNVIYSIINIIDNKRYIGQATDFKNRKISHLCSLRKNEHYNKHLQASYNKYGEEAFEFEILISDCIALDFQEKKWISHFNTTNHKCGYNMNDGGQNSSSIEQWRKIAIFDKEVGVLRGIFETGKKCADHLGTKSACIFYALQNPLCTIKGHYLRDYSEEIQQLDVPLLQRLREKNKVKAGKLSNLSKSLKKMPSKLLSTEELLPMITGNIHSDNLQNHGIDLNVISIKKILGGGFIPKEGKTILPEYEEILLNEDNTWYLEKGAYDLIFEQGCEIPNFAMLLIRQRSSLLRNGSIIHSSIFDAGFKAQNLGTVMIVNVPIRIQKGARIANIYGHSCDRVKELYSGQFQGDKQRQP